MTELQVIAESGTQNITLIRELNAPLARVFEAYTEPELVAQWLGPRRLEMKISEWNAVSGGGYAYLHIDSDGTEYGFRGTFHTVRTDELIIQTFEFLGALDAVSVETASFEDLGEGRTRLTSTATYPSAEVREMMLQSGMADGVKESYERLEELLS
ncbi:SRPBCC family protein [Psychromicrobium lacuslunae]|uniref:Activator of Hsp90 ATPase homologue 1/2-like C-terminal domain-containing protein n=1 Tax=Psychromicrobium lacuslunae TaxID=1618207 RepID=A0A0D4BW35_9MICC|nr:SRPBCC family protein [Psychromicrobium lacuslunae]AJT40513.1 hypothetical protein UM93_01285 [Psychromicrobium lacuslunae]